MSTLSIYASMLVVDRQMDVRLNVCVRLLAFKLEYSVCVVFDVLSLGTLWPFGPFMSYKLKIYSVSLFSVSVSLFCFFFFVFRFSLSECVFKNILKC